MSIPALLICLAIFTHFTLRGRLNKANPFSIDLAWPRMRLARSGRILVALSTMTCRHRPFIMSFVGSARNRTRPPPQLPPPRSTTDVVVVVVVVSRTNTDYYRKNVCSFRTHERYASERSGGRGKCVKCECTFARVFSAAGVRSVCGLRTCANDFRQPESVYVFVCIRFSLFSCMR